MPLCMREMHSRLLGEGVRHLKYFGRMTFIGFLKGLGLSLSDCKKYFQSRMKNFVRRYEYQVEYSYGKQGQRKDWRPFTCKDMYNLQQPNADQVHGCPFKTYGSSHLKQVLMKQDQPILSTSAIQSIVELAETDSFSGCSKACAKHFCFSHPRSSIAAKVASATNTGQALQDCQAAGLGVHPNAWFWQSLAGS